MQKPEILGFPCITPDGLGEILSLHNGAVEVHLNRLQGNQLCFGRKENALHFFYQYSEIELMSAKYQERNLWHTYQYGDKLKVGDLLKLIPTKSVENSFDFYQKEDNNIYYPNCELKIMEIEPQKRIVVMNIETSAFASLDYLGLSFYLRHAAENQNKV